MSRLRWPALLAALGGAAWLGHAIPRDAPAPRATAAECVGRSAAIDQAMVRGALRAELASLSTAPSSAPAVMRAAELPAPAAAVAGGVASAANAPTVSPRALDDGHRLIDQALTHGRWNAQDAAALRQLLG
ncbi:MAG TPA: hypothetical protein VF334_07960, partial [Polyangia bacterium]